MIRHIVIVNFDKKFDVDFEDLLEKTRPIVSEIPGIVSYQIFRNESQYVPEGVLSFGVEILFQDSKALSGFMKDPKHFEANSLFEQYLANPPFAVLTHKEINYSL